MDGKNLESIKDIKIVNLLLIALSHCMFFFSDNLFFVYKAEVMSPSVSFVVKFFDMFLVPAYVFCAGYLFALSQAKHDRPVSIVIKWRAIRLLVPYYFYGALWLVPLYTYFDIVSFGRPEHAGYLEGYKVMILGQFSDHLWFLWMLFDVVVIFALLKPLINKGKLLITGAITLAVALIVSLFLQDFPYFKVSQIAPYLICYFAGICFFTYNEKIKAISDRLCLAIAAALAVITLLFVLFDPSHWIARYVSLPVAAIFEFFLFRSFISSDVWKRYRNTRVYKYQADVQMEFYLLHMPLPILIFRLLDPYIGNYPWLCVFVNFALVIISTSIIIQIKRWVTAPLMPAWNKVFGKDKIKRADEIKKRNNP